MHCQVWDHFLATESPLKTMTNAFYFTSKARFVLKLFKFLSDFLVMQQNGLIRKIRLISNFMTSQPGWQTSAIHIFPLYSHIGPIPREVKTMKFGQLIEYNLKNIFLEKLYRKYGGETSPRPFSQKLKLTISLDQ